MSSSAAISNCGLYRYELTRFWADPQLEVLFIMLNPSVANAELDDPTIRRCLNFAKSWGCGSLTVCNLSAYRATNPKELRQVDDPVGPDNDSYLLQAVERCSKRIVVAWGTHGGLYGRDKKVLRLLGGHKLWCLGMTKNGHPKHPLFCPKDVRRVVFRDKQG